MFRYSRLIRNLNTTLSRNNTASHLSRLPRILNPKLVFGASGLTASYFLYIWLTDDGNAPSLYPKTLQAKVYRRLPSNLLSHIIGSISEVEIPVALRKLVFGTYIRLTGCSMDGVINGDLTEYTNLSNFFIRQISSHFRPIDAVSSLVSPSDGTIVYVGPVDKTLNHLNQVKGVTYSMDEFMGPSPLTDAPNQFQQTRLYQCTIYLAPGDYHGFHTPTDWIIKLRRHFPGKLLSVRPAFTNRLPGLFTVNERCVYMGSWKCGFMSLTAVGALGVGSISVPCDPSLITNRKKNQPIECLPGYRPSKYGGYEEVVFDDLDMRKGQLFGLFKMGSSIVLVFEGPIDGLKWKVNPGDRVKYGNALIEETP